MKPVFCGNLDYDVRYSEIERAFSKYGKIERIDMKSGKSIPSYAYIFSLEVRGME